MTFAWPYLLFLLAAPAGLLAAELARGRRLAAASRPKILRGQAGRSTLTFAPTAPPGAGRRPRYWLLAGLALTVLALARPQWGHTEEQVFDQSREILLAIDLSRSMLAQDIKPSRLDRAKLLIQSLLERLAGERVGLVVFSGTAFLQSPLSPDYEILREFLPALGPDYLPEGGTNYRALLSTAIDAFGSGDAADRFLVILSDGEATDDDWKSGAAALKQKGIRVIGLGVGTSAGAMIPDGAGGLVKDERGAVVLSKLESGTLQELAAATNGVYRDASSWIDLPELLQETVEAARKGNFTEKVQLRRIERFQWLLAPALLCLLVSFWREFPVHPKPRDLRLSAPPEEAGQTRPVRAAGQTVAALCLLSLVLSAPRALRAAEAGDAALAAPLSKVVGRIAAEDRRTAADWGELARTTVTYGQRLQSSQQPVPAGPVQDGLAAVDTGAALDPKAADWPQLRSQLEALLQKSQEQNQKPPPQQQQQQQDQQNQQQQQQKQPDQQKQDQQSQQSSAEQQKQDGQNGNSQPKDQNAPQPKEGQENRPNQEQAFKDMTKSEAPSKPPTPASGETQRVGGAPQQPAAGQNRTDPALAAQLEKLDELRNQDSPARLFQLMNGGESKSEIPKNGKNW